MIIVEDILRQIFSQLPPATEGIKSFPIKFEWGGEKDLNLYIKNAEQKYPLIWLVQGRETHSMYSNNAEKPLRLIIAKNSSHVTSRNPQVWDTEFTQYLNPILENVIKAFERSGVTTIMRDGEYDVERRANYTEESSEDKTKTIDFWNVIILEITIRFEEKANGEPKCINQIKF